jgi:hypothetical protein
MDGVGATQTRAGHVEDRAKIKFKTGKFQAATNDDKGWALSGADALRQRRASA